MAPPSCGRSGTHEKAEVATERNRSAQSRRTPGHIRERPRLPRCAEDVESPSTEGAGRCHFTVSPPDPVHELYHPGKYPGTEPLWVPRQQLEPRGRREANDQCHKQRRVSTPASDQINWGSDPSPMPGETVRPRPGFARTLDVMEDLLPSPPPELHMRGYHEISEMTPGNRLMETCEAEGRDPLLALRALKNEYMATEERRLSELVFAHDRIRDLEEELGRSLHHVQALKEHLWELQNQDRLIERQNQLIRDLNRTNEQQVHIIEQQARQITTLQERMTNPPHARRQIRDRRSGRSRRS